MPDKEYHALLFYHGILGANLLCGEVDRAPRRIGIAGDGLVALPGGHSYWPRSKSTSDSTTSGAHDGLLRRLSVPIGKTTTNERSYTSYPGGECKLGFSLLCQGCHSSWVAHRSARIPSCTSLAARVAYTLVLGIISAPVFSLLIL